MKFLTIAYLLGSSLCMAADGDVFLNTDQQKFIKIPAEEAKVLQSHQKWLAERMADAMSIRVGSTYADLIKLFTTDGGISVPDHPRYCLILCPYIKVEVEFEKHTPLSVSSTLPPGTKISKISKPFLETPFSD